MLFFLVRLSQHLVFDAMQKHTTLDDLYMNRRNYSIRFVVRYCTVKQTRYVLIVHVVRWNNVHYLTVEFNNPFKLLLD